MKKIVTLVLLVVLCVIYLFPMKFDSLLQDADFIEVSQIVFKIDSTHEPLLELQTYEFGQPNEQTELLELLKTYRYRRTYNSLSKATGMEDIGDALFYFYIYQKDGAQLEYKCMISISSTGQMILDDHLYRLVGDSKEFTAKMQQLLQNHPKLMQEENAEADEND